MTAHDGIDKLIRALDETRFKEFEQRVLRGKAQAERDAKVLETREKRRRDFMAAIGTDLTKLDAASEAENRAQEAELKSFLDEIRPKLAGRRSNAAATAKEAAIRAQTLAQSGHLALPVFSSSIFAADKAILKDIVEPDWTAGAIDSGWVLPDDPSDIHIMDYRHYPNALCWDNRWTPPPQFSVYFSFVPATTASYEMTAYLAFRGFYVLHSDDSWWNCRAAGVKLTVQTSVTQYVTLASQETTLIDVEKSNAQELDNYDLTKFFTLTAGLRAGDPVVVTVTGTVEATAHGGGAYAELNFASGTANYIQPLLLSVLQS